MAEAAGAPSTKYAVRAVERTLDILDVLAQHPAGLTAPQIADAVSMPRSTVFRYLAVLEARHYVSRFDVVRFRLGSVFLSFEQPILNSFTATARPLLERLRDKYDETINLGILVGTRVLYADVQESPHAIRLSARPGDRDFIHSSALGKALSAQLNDDQVREILEAEGMPRRTPNTITELQAFMVELEKVRERGFATDMSESEEGASCVAVAIDTSTSPLRAAVSLSSPSIRFRKERLDEVVNDLRAAADEIAIVSVRKAEQPHDRGQPSLA
ncbi:MAG TPA: IclR family transcriptional regulator [Solirubrobacteraceae bacterium]|nr:IclR family transcriptional regulator [Solirubrobacteraceae bacterium]